MAGLKASRTLTTRRARRALIGSAEADSHDLTKARLIAPARLYGRRCVEVRVRAGTWQSIVRGATAARYSRVQDTTE